MWSGSACISSSPKIVYLCMCTYIRPCVLAKNSSCLFHGYIHARKKLIVCFCLGTSQRQQQQLEIEQQKRVEWEQAQAQKLARQHLNIKLKEEEVCLVFCHFFSCFLFLFIYIYLFYFVLINVWWHAADHKSWWAKLGWVKVTSRRERTWQASGSYRRHRTL